MDLVDWAVDLEVEGVVSRNQAADTGQGRQLPCCISSKIVNVDACCIALSSLPLRWIGVESNHLVGNIFRPFEFKTHSISLHLTVISSSSVSFDRVNIYHQVLHQIERRDHTFSGSESKRCNTFLAPSSPCEAGSRD